MNRDRVMQRMLRQRQELEAKRAQVTRRGAVDINQVDQATYRDDLGFNMTRAGYEKYLEEKAEFDKYYNDVIGSNRTALEKLSGLEAKAKGGMTSVEKEWQRAQKTFVPVRVVASDNKTVEGTYRLPKEVVDAMHRESFNKGNGTYVGNWHGGYYNVSVVPRGTSNAYGKELHNALSSAYTQVKSKFWDEVAPKVSSANKVTQSTLGQIQGHKSTALGNIELANQQRDSRQSTLDRMKKDYEEKKAARQALFTGGN